MNAYIVYLCFYGVPYNFYSKDFEVILWKKLI